jgi:hypothetical protein
MTSCPARVNVTGPTPCIVTAEREIWIEGSELESFPQHRPACARRARTIEPTT